VAVAVVALLVLVEWVGHVEQGAEFARYPKSAR
jgi:hypothetical protein